MDEVDGDLVASVGMEMTLKGAVIIPDGKHHGSLHIQPDVTGYASGKSAVVEPFGWSSDQCNLVYNYTVMKKLTNLRINNFHYFCSR